MTRYRALGVVLVVVSAGVLLAGLDTTAPTARNDGVERVAVTLEIRFWPRRDVAVGWHVGGQSGDDLLRRATLPECTKSDPCTWRRTATGRRGETVGLSGRAMSGAFGPRRTLCAAYVGGGLTPFAGPEGEAGSCTLRTTVP